jgi:hypothetical protein
MPSPSPAGTPIEVTFGALYYVMGGALFRAPNAPITPIVIEAALNIVLLLVLLSPPARRLCSPRSASRAGEAHVG